MRSGSPPLAATVAVEQPFTLNRTNAGVMVGLMRDIEAELNQLDQLAADITPGVVAQPNRVDKTSGEAFLRVVLDRLGGQVPPTTTQNP
jgi:hypothetical protein